MTTAVDTSPIASTDPFGELPAARTVVGRFVVGLIALICAVTVVGMLVLSGLMAGLRRWDAGISADLADDRSDSLSDLALFMTKAGDTLPILVILASVTLFLAALRKWRAMLFVPMAVLAEILTFLSVNYLVGRERPSVVRLGPLPGTYSFPSGHVAATFVCWVGISLLLAAYGYMRLGRVVAALGTAMAVAMAWARVYVGMHHTVDVIAGLAVGIAALILVIRVLNVRFRSSASRSP